MKINKLIGNTPIVEIKVRYKNKIKNIYAKLEYYNYTGSIKDRLAQYIIQESYKDGSLKEGMPIIEATSGNTGIAFAAIGALYNHPVHIFMPEWASEERIKIMKLYGATVHLVSKNDGGFIGAIKKADELAREINGFRPDQFSNKLNFLTHYNTTGKEIVKKIDKIEAFVNGVGTGGTLMGIASRIKKDFPKAKIIAMEPENVPLLSNGEIKGSHKIEGIGDDFIPDIVNTSLIDRVITINDNDALKMTQKLAKELGLGVGISSGANFLAAVLSEENNIVTIFADDFKKYLSTDLSLNINDESIVDLIDILDINGT